MNSVCIMNGTSVDQQLSHPLRVEFQKSVYFVEQCVCVRHAGASLVLRGV